MKTKYLGSCVCHCHAEFKLWN